ncbi:MAG: efflux RND transporter permease subunit, partial [Wolinella sp.]
AAATTVCAFLPMLLMSGEIGQFMRLIPTAVSVLLLASLLESFFFLPLHCAHTLSKNQKTRDWSKINALYHRSLHFLFDHRRLFLGIALVLIPLAIIFSFIFSKYQLITQFDGTEVYVSGRLSGNYTVEETHELVNKLEAEILHHKAEFFVRSTSAIAGIRIDKTGESEAASNLFHIFVELEDAIEDNFVERYITPILSFSWGEDSHKIRTLKSYEIEKRLQTHLEGFKNAHPFEELKVSSPSMGITKHDVEITLMGKNDEVIAALNRLQSLMEGVKGVKGVYQQSQRGIAQIKLAINPYGESLGLNEGNLGTILGDYFLSSKRGKSIDSEGVIYLHAEESRKDELMTLQNLRIPIAGKYVRLDEVVDLKTEQASEKIKKIGGEREQSIYADVLPNELTSFELLGQVEGELERIKKEGITVRLGGEQEKNNQFIRDMIVASILALSLIFLTLLLMFDSFLISFAILSVIPLSFLGVLLGHFILGLNLSMSSFVGILGLAGVVINDGIVMIDFIRKADSKEEFFSQATKRLRPILLTSITTFIGLATLIFFPSGQATTLQPLAVSLGFGLAWGTVLNLYYLPLLFVLLHEFKRPDSRALIASIRARLNKKSL